MDRGPLSDPKVVERITRARAVRLRVFVDEHPDLCRRARVPDPGLRDERGIAPYPSLQIWTPSGVLVDRTDGVVPPRRFLTWLEAGFGAWPEVARREAELLARVEAEPGAPRPLEALAGFYERRRSYPLAAGTWARLARGADPAGEPRHDAHLRAAHAFLKHAGYAEADAHLALAAEEGASTREAALYLLGFSAQQAGDAPRARRHYEALLEAFPESRFAPAAREALGAGGATGRRYF